MITYTININAGSESQKQFIENTMNIVLESVKRNYESKHKNNELIWQEIIN